MIYRLERLDKKNMKGCELISFGTSYIFSHRILDVIKHICSKLTQLTDDIQ